MFPDRDEDEVESFRQTLADVFGRLESEPWFRRAINYVLEINTTDRPRSGMSIVLATTHRGGHLPTKITYYLKNIHNRTFEEVYRITKHEFAHLWGLDEKDAQDVEKS